MGLACTRVFFRASGCSGPKVVMVGLDGSGKTSLLATLMGRPWVPPPPTIGFTVETVHVQLSSGRRTQLTVWDVSGSSPIRRLWRHYTQAATLVIFVVDSTDAVRFEQAANEMRSFLSENDESLHACPLVVLANKMDLENARSLEEIYAAMNLGELKNRAWKLTACSARTRADTTAALASIVWATDAALSGEARRVASGVKSPASCEDDEVLLAAHELSNSRHMPPPPVTSSAPPAPAPDSLEAAAKMFVRSAG